MLHEISMLTPAQNISIYFISPFLNHKLPSMKKLFWTFRSEDLDRFLDYLILELIRIGQVSCLDQAVSIL